LRQERPRAFGRWAKTCFWLVLVVLTFKMMVDQNREPDDESNVSKTKQIWVKQKYMDYLKTLGPIPRIVHILFPNKTFVEHNEFNMVKFGIGKLIEQNPDWELRIYDDADIDGLIANATDLLPLEERNLLLGANGKGAAHIVEKTDIARLIVMYNFGGLYSDFDRIFNVPLDNVLRSGPAALCLPTFRDDDFMQSLMCSAPKNQLFQQTIQIATEKRIHGGPNNTPMERRDGWLRRDALLSLGPPTFNLAVSDLVFEGPLMTKPGEPQASRKHMALARAAIQETNGLIVTAVDTGCDGFFSKSSNGCPPVNKREVQKFFGMREWSPQVKERWNEKWYSKWV